MTKIVEQIGYWLYAVELSDGKVYHTIGNNIYQEWEAYAPTIDSVQGARVAIFGSREAAGEAAYGHWNEMVQRDPEGFASIVGIETLIDWCYGRYGGPGNLKTKSLEEWLEEFPRQPRI